MEQINNYILKRLISEHGTPFYVMFPERYRQNLQSFMAAFHKRYDRIIVGYSFKTNYLPRLCAIARKEGCYAEVVSEMELELAIKLGFKEIIFNGPIKKDNAITTAIENGAIINLDAEYEVDSICQFKREHPDKQLKIGLRLNVQLENEKGESAIQNGLRHGRFGFPHKVLRRNIDKLRAADIEICSLHGHTSSSDRAVNNYKIITEYMLSVREEFRLESVKYFDIGGGFFGAAPYGMNISGKPSYDDYAQMVLSVLHNDPWFLKTQPYIVIEPGSSVVSNVFEYYTSIFQQKTIGSKRFVIVDGSFFDVKPTMHSSNLPFSLIPMSVAGNEQEEYERCDVVGSTCMEKDVIMHDVRMPFFQRGDLINIKGVGAYTLSLTPTFINYLAPVFSFENEELILVRRRQKIEDLLNIYLI